MWVSIVVCVALSGFLFGYDTAIINAAVFQMKDHFGFDKESWLYGFIVSIAIVGCFAGCFLSGIISTYWGRRSSIFLADIFFILGSILMTFAPKVAMVLVGRVIVGLGIGLSSAITPVYLAEVTSSAHRGSIVVLNSLFLTFGQFIAAGLGALLVIYTSNNLGWRIAVGLGALPAALQLVCLYAFLPESPRWLAYRGDIQKARSVATRFDLDFPAQSGIASDEAVAAIRLNYGALMKKGMRSRVLLCCGLHIIQQFSGINTIMYYSSIILSDAGFDDHRMPVLLSVPLAFLNALFTAVAIFTVERIGRRPMLLFSCLGCIGATAAAALLGFLLNHPIPYAVGGWLFLGILCIFLEFYAPGIGCIPWVIMGEIFPVEHRTSASSIATMANWGANAIVSQTFPLLLGAIGVGATFAIITGLLVLGFVVIWFYVVETKGLTLEQIEVLFTTGYA